MDGSMTTHSEYLEEFKEIAESESENRTRQLEDLRFGFADDQWPDQLRKARQLDPHGARPCLTINKIPAHARQIVNEMRQSRSSIKVIPLDDHADIETAEVLQGIIRHIEHISNAEQAYSTASEFQVMAGLGYFMITTEYTDPIYNEQDIRIKPIRNPFNVYLDPWITDITGGDAKVCYLATTVSRRSFEQDYPQAEMVDVESDQKSGDWFSDKGVRLCERFSIHDYEEKYVLVNGVARPVDKYDSNRDGPYTREASMAKKRLKWCLMSGREILDEQDRPGQYIPIIRVAGEDIDIDGERIVTGIVRRARDSQQMYNFTVSAIAERNALEPKAPWLVAEESIEGHENEFAAANRSNLPYLTYNAMSEDGTPLPPPQRQFPTGANSALIQQQMGADGDIQATIGQFAASLGQPSNEKSGTAIRQRQMIGDIATYHYPDNFGRAIRQAGRVIVDLIPQIYDTDRVARILGEDGETDTVRLSQSIDGPYQETEHGNIYNVGVGKYDVAVDVGPSYATKRQEAFEAMAQMTQGNPQLWGVIGDLLVKNMDWPGASEMAKRLKATIPPEIRQDEEEGEPMDPEVMAKFQEMAQAIEMSQQQMGEMAQQNAELQNTIKGKMIEQEMKQQDHAMKMAEMEQERALKQMEYDQRQTEAIAKQQDAATKLAMQAEKNVAEYDSIAELVTIASTGAQQTAQILAALAESTQQNGEMLAAMLGEMAKPKQLAVTTDSDGNVVGGVSRTIQ